MEIKDEKKRKKRRKEFDARQAKRQKEIVKLANDLYNLGLKKAELEYELKINEIYIKHGSKQT